MSDIYNVLTQPESPEDRRITTLTATNGRLKRELAAAKEEIERLRKDKSELIGFHTMQLVAISTASLQNTEKSKLDRIGADNPYASTAYFDVCAAIDREIKLRSSLSDLRKVADDLDDHSGHGPNCMMFAGVARCNCGRSESAAAFAAWKARNE